MQIVYLLEDFPTTVTKSISLASLAEGDQSLSISWHDDALHKLAKSGYDGVVYVPTYRNGGPSTEATYAKEVEWEDYANYRADVLLFWFPEADQNSRLAASFGIHADSRRVWYGRPNQCLYTDHQVLTRGMPIFETLDSLIESALIYLGKGIKRTGGASLVPMVVYRTQQFREWYENHCNVGNELVSFKVKAIIHFRNKNNPEGYTFGYSAFVAIRNKEEDRIKNDEWIFSRTQVSYVVCYHHDEEYDELAYVLVRDFRSPANNQFAYIYEHPGGSAGEHDDPLPVAAKELKEEIGLDIAPDRLNALTNIQTFATMLTNKVNLYSVELTDDEWATVNKFADEHTVLGENDLERITLVIAPESKLGAYPVDLCTYGAIHINKHFLSLEKGPDPFTEA